MNLKNQPPIFVPEAFRAEIEKLSKAALMDLVWDYAAMLADGDDEDKIMAEFRERREVILMYREREKP